MLDFVLSLPDILNTVIRTVSVSLSPNSDVFVSLGLMLIHFLLLQVAFSSFFA